MLQSPVGVIFQNISIKIAHGNDFFIFIRKFFQNALEKNIINPLSANPEKWSKTLKQIVGKLPCLSVFDHFMNLALKGLNSITSIQGCLYIHPTIFSFFVYYLNKNKFKFFMFVDFQVIS